MDSRPYRVVILGAGINGCALARELLLNDVSVCLVEMRDIASGTTSYSSRLIHGGLRYLEHGEFDLVRESLAERTRLLRLAPHLVRPLELSIPVSNRFGGLLSSAARFVGWRRWPATSTARRGRGLTLVRSGLAFYDSYAKDPVLPRHRVNRTSSPEALAVDRGKYRWLCSYYDAQLVYPEQFTVALAEDARKIAQAAGLDFQLWTYHRASLNGRSVEIRKRDGALATEPFEPDTIVNATGAWVDRTLGQLHIGSRRLVGGTKGSHVFTFHDRLRRTLAGRGMYAEVRDGRPIFITPLEDTVLIGTTDEPFDGDPQEAVATEPEIGYLLSAVNSILSDIKLTRGDVDFHYSGVRPLPYQRSVDSGAITRRHWLQWHDDSPVPLVSVIGGKLTTCRSLAEQATHAILAQWDQTPQQNSRERALPGGDNHPHDPQQLAALWQQLAERHALDLGQVEAMWGLCGTRTPLILAEMPHGDASPIAGPFPRFFVRWIIRNQWVRTLEDLVERRLMLLYHQRLTRGCLRELAKLLASEAVISEAEVEPQVQAQIDRLQSHFGKRVDAS